MFPPELNIRKYYFIITSIYVCPGSTDAPDQPTVTNLVRGMVQKAVDVDEVRVGAEAQVQRVLANCGAGDGD